jgi:hypothetical protein
MAGSLCFSTANNETVCYAPDYITEGGNPNHENDLERLLTPSAAIIKPFLSSPLEDACLGMHRGADG